MVTLLTTYLPVSAALTNFSYLPSDQTAYTATSAAGQRGTLFVPVGTPADYPRVYGGAPSTSTRWKTLVVAHLSGDSPNGTTSQVPSTSLTASSGLPYNAVRAGFAVFSVQQTSQASTNTGITGLGFVHLPGGTQGYYESKNRPSHIKDLQFAIQHIRWNATSYPPGHASSYGLSGWIAVTGINSTFGLPFICSAPNRAGELGSGGPYEMSTVPNFVFGSAIYPFRWAFFKDDEANTGCFFAKAESGGAGQDDTVSATIAAAPARYVRDYGAEGVLSDFGAPCHPKMFCFSNTGPEDTTFGPPYIDNTRKFATGVHDSKHMYALKQALPPGWVELRVPPQATYTLSETQATANVIPPPYYDGSLALPTAHVAATGTITLSGQPADGNTVTISDGRTFQTFEFDNNAAVTAPNTTVTIGASKEDTLDALRTAIGAYGFTLSTSDASGLATVTYTSTEPTIAANVTWAKSGANIAVTGLTGGVQIGQAAGHLASIGAIAFSGNTADGDTITIGDGYQTVTYEFDTGGGVAAGNVAVTNGTAAQSVTRILAAIRASGLKLYWVGFNTVDSKPSTTQVNFVSTAPDIAANVTWAKSGANITVAGLTGGSAGAQTLTDETDETGYALRALIAHCNDERWDKKMPATGIRRESQVNTTGRCIVPQRIEEDRGYIRLTNTDATDTLLYGPTFASMTGRLEAGQTVDVYGNGKLFAKASDSVCTYRAREMPVGA